MPVYILTVKIIVQKNLAAPPLKGLGTRWVAKEFARMEELGAGMIITDVMYDSEKSLKKEPETIEELIADHVIKNSDRQKLICVQTEEISKKFNISMRLANALLEGLAKKDVIFKDNGGWIERV